MGQVTPAGRRESWLRRKFGITTEEYEAMVEGQGGVCAICDKPPKTLKLGVDHCHRSGDVRGALCMRCNRGLQMFSDSVYHLERAVFYLKRAPFRSGTAVLGRVTNKVKRRKHGSKTRKHSIGV